MDFSDAALFAAQSGYEKITETVKAVRKKLSPASEDKLDEKTAEQLNQLKEKFEAAMNDDLNTSIALSVIFELVRLANKLLEDTNTAPTALTAVDDLFTSLGGDVLGVVKDQYPQTVGGDDLAEKLIELFIEQRNQARSKKDFAAADAIRAKLDDIGIALEDNPAATEWRRK